MNLFQFDKLSYKVRISEETLLLKPFKDVYKKDKSRTKDKAINEFAYIWFFADIRSPYQSIIDEEERTVEIVKDTELPDNWKPDNVIKEAIEFYKERSKTIIVNLHNAAMIAASAVNDTFSNSKALIQESDDQIGAAEKVIRALEKVPKVMQSLRDVEKQLLKEIDDKEGKKKGAKTFGLYEDGLDI